MGIGRGVCSDKADVQLGDMMVSQPDGLRNDGQWMPAWCRPKGWPRRRVALDSENDFYESLQFSKPDGTVLQGANFGGNASQVHFLQGCAWSGMRQYSIASRSRKCWAEGSEKSKRSTLKLSGYETTGSWVVMRAREFDTLTHGITVSATIESFRLWRSL